MRRTKTSFIDLRVLKMESDQRLTHHSEKYDKGYFSRKRTLERMSLEEGKAIKVDIDKKVKPGMQ